MLQSKAVYLHLEYTAYINSHVANTRRPIASTVVSTAHILRSGSNPFCILTPTSDEPKSELESGTTDSVTIIYTLDCSRHKQELKRTSR